MKKADGSEDKGDGKRFFRNTCILSGGVFLLHKSYTLNSLKTNHLQSIIGNIYELKIIKQRVPA